MMQFQISLNIAAIALSTLLISACQAPAQPSPDQEQTSEATQKAEEVEQTVKFVEAAKLETARDLRDPSSAQFRDLMLAHTDTRKVLCGEINAKNAFGAYTGFVGFVAIEMPSSISTSIAKDGQTVEKAEPCNTTYNELPKDLTSEQSNARMRAAGCDISNYDFMFWANRDIFCRAAIPLLTTERAKD